MKYAINGLISLTPDGMPILGETPEVKGLWSAAAVWVKEGPGVGKSLAEWMVHGESQIDLHSSDIARFHDHQKTRAHVKARTAEAFPRPTGSSTRPSSGRPTATSGCSPMHEREQELGAVFFEAAGWERPQWYESNAPLVEQYGVGAARGRVGRALVVADHQRRAPRDARARRDLRPVRVRDLRRRTGPGALDALQRSRRCAQMDVAVGRVVYTPVLSPSGGFKSDLTIMRLGDEHFRVVTGGAHGMADRKWFADHLPDDGSAQLVDLTTAWTTIGLWGPRARDILASRHARRRLARGLPVRHAAGRSRSARSSSLASRISYVGDLGWELYVPIEQGARLWDVLWEAGRPHGAHRLRDRRLRHDRPAREGLPRLRRRARERVHRRRGRHGSGRRSRTQDFVGKEAHLRHREEEPAAILCTLTVDDHTSASGVKRYPLGREPITLARRRAAHRREGPPLVRHERGRRPVARQARPHGVPAARARGRGLARARRSSTWTSATRSRSPSSARRPLFDPENTRIRLVRVLVCVKRVPLTGGKIVLTEDAQAIETRHLGFTISPHEECGVEEAVRLVEAARRRVGRAHARPGRGGGAAARRDGDRHRPRRSTSSRTARSGTRRRRPARSSTRSAADEAANGPFDLVFFGNESADAGDYQVGIRVAHALGRPVATGLKGAARRGRLRPLRAGGRPAGATSTSCRCPPSSPCSRGSTCRATRRCPGRCARRRSRSTHERRRGPAARLEKLRLVVPQGAGQAGRGARRGPARPPRASSRSSSEIGVLG